MKKIAKLELDEKDTEFIRMQLGGIRTCAGGELHVRAEAHLKNINDLIDQAYQMGLKDGVK